MKHAWMVVLALCAAPAVAGTLAVDSVVVDASTGKTHALTCANTRGYYLEIGERTLVAARRAKGTVNLPVARLVPSIVPPGWKVVVQKRLNPKLMVAWSGNRIWPEALEQIARENNLAVIVDWSRRQVYLDRV